MVFDLIVEAAENIDCKLGPCQYFLLSPSLLPDRTFALSITFLFIYNGPFNLNEIIKLCLNFQLNY